MAINAHDSTSRFDLMEYSYDDYTIGWICALPLEMTAATGMLDEKHTSLPAKKRDPNSYVLGAIVGSTGKHNAVIACLPAGTTGTVSAAIVASTMQNTFKTLRFGLMVGIGGGVPSKNADIRLGDVVVSQPAKESNSGGVIQFDFGKTIIGGRFQRTGVLNKPPPVLANAVAKPQSRHTLEAHNLLIHMEAMWAEYRKTRSKFVYQGSRNYQLFNANYDHFDSHKDCQEY